MYCGPLRLLAYEVYERINKDGKYYRQLHHGRFNGYPPTPIENKN
jgi:hypothetical protein